MTPGDTCLILGRYATVEAVNDGCLFVRYADGRADVVMENAVMPCRSKWFVPYLATVDGVDVRPVEPPSDTEVL